MRKRCFPSGNAKGQIFLTFYFDINSHLQRSCKKCTKDSYVFFPQIHQVLRMKPATAAIFIIAKFRNEASNRKITKL